MIVVKETYDFLSVFIAKITIIDALCPLLIFPYSTSKATKTKICPKIIKSCRAANKLAERTYN